LVASTLTRADRVAALSMEAPVSADCRWRSGGAGLAPAFVQFISHDFTANSPPRRLAPAAIRPLQATAHAAARIPDRQRSS